MVGADKGTGTTAAAGYLHTAMTTGIDKGAHLAIFAANHYQRSTSGLAGDITAFIWYCCRGAERYWPTAQHYHLSIKSFLGMIMLYRFPPGGVSKVGGAIIYMGENSLNGLLVV
jgi:hypothetical protein